jgi:DNA-binding transcriptional LysR family regulator
VGLPLEDRSGLLLERVARVELMVALPEGHRLATRQTVALGELADERFLLFPRDFNPGYYDYLVGRCREAGFDPEVVRGGILGCTPGPPWTGWSPPVWAWTCTCLRRPTRALRRPPASC